MSGQTLATAKLPRLLEAFAVRAALREWPAALPGDVAVSETRAADNESVRPALLLSWRGQTLAAQYPEWMGRPDVDFSAAVERCALLVCKACGSVKKQFIRNGETGKCHCGGHRRVRRWL